MAHETCCSLETSDWLDITGRLAPGADPKTIESQMQVELKQWLLGPDCEACNLESESWWRNKLCICLPVERECR